MNDSAFDKMASPNNDDEATKVTSNPNNIRKRKTITTKDLKDAETLPNTPQTSMMDEKKNTVNGQMIQNDSKQRHQQMIQRITEFVKETITILLLPMLTFSFFLHLLRNNTDITDLEPEDSDSTYCRNLFFTLTFVSTLANALLIHLYHPPPPLTFPHPLLWNMFYSLCLHYTLFLFLLAYPSFYSPSYTLSPARHVLQILFPKFGTSQTFHQVLHANIYNIMGTCAISSTTIYRQIFLTPYFLSHVIGWCLKICIFRSFRMAFMASVLFEIVEVSLKHVVPEFEECWWDALFLDALGANLVGLGVGYWFLCYCDDRRRNNRVENKNKNDGTAKDNKDDKIFFDWWPTSHTPKSNDNTNDDTSLFSHLLHHTSPFPTTTSINNKYSTTSLPIQQVLLAILPSFIMILSETLSFVLINTFEIVDNTCLFVQWRLYSVVFVCFGALVEYYQRYVKKRKEKKKRFLTLYASTTILEIWICWKYFPMHMQKELELVGNWTGIPYHVIVAHCISYTFIIIWFLLRYKYIGQYIHIPFSTKKEHDLVQSIVKEATVMEKKKNNEQNQQNNPKYHSWRTTTIEKWNRFQKLTCRLKCQVVVISMVDLILVFAFLPMCYLFYHGWKWD